jgi:hypothetical protein
MPNNVLDVVGQTISVLAGTTVLLGMVLVLALRQRTRRKPAASGERPRTDSDVERISPDGYIDSFANRIQEAGGGLPTIGLVIMLIVLVCWFVYLIMFWQPA